MKAMRMALTCATLGLVAACGSAGGGGGATAEFTIKGVPFHVLEARVKGDSPVNNDLKGSHPARISLNSGCDTSGGAFSRKVCAPTSGATATIICTRQGFGEVGVLVPERFFKDTSSATIHHRTKAGKQPLVFMKVDDLGVAEKDVVDAGVRGCYGDVSNPNAVDVMD